MRKQLFILFFMGFSSIVFAQAPLGVGEMQGNGGVGFSSWGIPMYVGLDYGVDKDITIGGEFSFRSYSDKYSNIYYDHNVVGLSVNGNYHFNRILEIPSIWDFYAGLNLGFYFWNSPSGYDGSHSSGLGLGAQIGGRYFITDKIGVNLEFGGGNAFSSGKLGLTIKL